MGYYGERCQTITGLFIAKRVKNNHDDEEDDGYAC